MRQISSLDVYLLCVAQNGMTPLHLAVWFSVRGGTVAPVEALLQYDADICAKDDVKFSPVR